MTLYHFLLIPAAFILYKPFRRKILGQEQYRCIDYTQGEQFWFWAKSDSAAKRKVIKEVSSKRFDVELFRGMEQVIYRD